MMLTATQKPAWLNKRVSLRECRSMQDRLCDLNLHTVCQEASCPNISECFSKRQTTFLILGKSCTRGCSFCGVDKRAPSDIDIDEPERVAEAVRRLDLKHTVITSVTRDDLDDGGAGFFAKTISSIRKKVAGVTIESLIPDFQGSEDSLRKIVEAKPDIIGHNLETVPRLYKELRPQADYGLSLNLLKMVKELSNGNGVYTKSGLMLGLGESQREVLDVFCDLRKTGCDFLSIGQYLAPSRSHFPVKEYITPEQFLDYKNEALKLAFLYVASAPYVRSSYLASQYIKV